MPDSPIALEMKSDMREITKAIKKLTAISNALPVTVANFVHSSGGMPGLIGYDISQDADRCVYFKAKPNEKMLRFLEIFADDDLAEPSGEFI